MEGWFLNALALLLTVVIEQTEGIAPQNDNGNQVAGGEERHEEIDQVPYQVKARNSSEQHHDTTGKDAIDGHHHRLFCDEAHIRLAIIVVAYNGGVGKDEDG